MYSELSFTVLTCKPAKFIFLGWRRERQSKLFILLQVQVFVKEQATFPCRRRSSAVCLGSFPCQSASLSLDRGKKHSCLGLCISFHRWAVQVSWVSRNPFRVGCGEVGIPRGPLTCPQGRGTSWPQLPHFWEKAAWMRLYVSVHRAIWLCLPNQQMRHCVQTPSQVPSTHRGYWVDVNTGVMQVEGEVRTGWSRERGTYC